LWYVGGEKERRKSEGNIGGDRWREREVSAEGGRGEGGRESKRKEV
jgi:hypothetical protein